MSIDNSLLYCSQFLMPGFVDTHIHAPQYRFTGTGYDKQLLDWLKTYTFPTEAAFSDVSIAREVYPRVVVRSIQECINFVIIIEKNTQQWDNDSKLLCNHPFELYN